jgi:peroxiredoxin (alkyl hydroperoxide reductase subunit C)
MSELKDGCVKPARGPIMAQTDTDASAEAKTLLKEVNKVVAKVGKEAIDFEANAYVEGYGFKTIRLSDYKGKWIVLCFYPGDFTFV